MSGEKDESIGSVSEEALKLLGALQDWARESRSDASAAAGSAASGATSSLGAINDHIATGGQDCRYCPICQVISAVRDTSPEVKQHLASAATSLMKAVAGVMETHVPDGRGGKGDGGVEKIDLSEGDDWEDEQ